jgi:hypothetical protein
LPQALTAQRVGQGWYHGPKDDTKKRAVDKATVNQLIAHSKTSAAADASQQELPQIVAPAEGTVTPLSESDKAILAQFVNPAYLTDDASLKVRDKFEEVSYVLLYDFLLPHVLEEVRGAAAEADADDKVGRGRLASYTSGYHEGWNAVGPPHMRRYLRFDGAAAPADAGQTAPRPRRAGGGAGGGGAGASSGALLKRIQVDLMQTAAFARLLARLTGIACTSSKGETRRFRAGLDYTVWSRAADPSFLSFLRLCCVFRMLPAAARLRALGRRLAAVRKCLPHKPAGRHR